MDRGFVAIARKKLLRRSRVLMRSGRGGELGEMERMELAEIHAALERIERGVYGSCDRCFGPVVAEDLEVHPWTRFCHACRPEEATLPLG